MCEAPTPSSISLRSVLLIVFSFTASFLLAAGAMAMLRGSDTTDQDAGSKPAAVEVDGSPFPNVGPWRVAVAATLSGRSPSVTVLRGPKALNAAPSAGTAQPLGESDAARKLDAELERLRGGDAEQEREVLKKYLDTSGLEAGGQPDAREDSATAVASASLLGGIIAPCRAAPKRPAAVDALKAVTAPRARPHVMLAGTPGNDTVVSEVAIVGGGKQRVAVAIVARVPSQKPATAQSGIEVVEKVADWLDDHLSAPDDYEPAC